MRHVFTNCFINMPCQPCQVLGSLSDKRMHTCNCELITVSKTRGGRGRGETRGGRGEGGGGASGERLLVLAAAAGQALMTSSRLLVFIND